MKNLDRVSLLAPFLSLFITLLASGAHAQVRGLPDFADLVEKQGPTVVNISTTQRVNVRRNEVLLDHFGGAIPFEEGDPRLDFFRRFFPRPQGQGGSQRESVETHSLGSGFIVSADGTVLTNAHVVEGADEITVRLTDKREYSAKLIGADKRTDVAVLKIEANGLPVARIGDSAQLRPGEWVVAIGSPFGFDNSVTAGIVSAKGRSLPQENYVPFIQTDVAINPGNSGGPLFNMKGEVVGINSQIYSRNGGYMGVSFAIPMDVAMDIHNQLRTSGKVSRGRIGVMIQEVSKELAESLNFGKTIGAVVGSVEKNGPADKAGIEAGDIILKFDGKAIVNSADLPRLVGLARPGSKSILQVWRRGNIRDIPVIIGEMADDKLSSSVAGTGKSTDRSINRLGLVLRELTAEQKNALKLGNGLWVEDARGLNGRADIRSGDVILALANKGTVIELKNVDQLKKLLAQFEKGANVTLLIRRGDTQTFVTIKVLDGN
jgi:serine protease Do